MDPKYPVRRRVDERMERRELFVGLGPPFTVRFWLDAEHPLAASDDTANETANLLVLEVAVEFHGTQHAMPQEIAEYLFGRCPAINAVEVVRQPTGSGVVLYRDWP